MQLLKSTFLSGFFFLMLSWSAASVFAACPDEFGVSLQPLDFGEFIPNSGGVLRLFPDGEIRTTSGSVMHVEGGSAGSVLVDGEASTLVLIEGFQPTSLTSEHGDNMQVVFFEADSPFVVIDSSCTGEFKIGATLIVNENQPQGLYEGHLDITIRHQ